MVASPYRSLVETSSRLAEVDFFDEVDASCIDDATALLQRIRPILDSTEDSLCERCEVPVEYKPDFFSYHMDDVQHLRNLSRALRFACDVAVFNGDFTSVAQYGATILELANGVRRGGLVVDQLVAIAISGVGIESLRSVRDRYDDNVRRNLIATLLRYEGEREPFGEIAQRDAKWEAESGYEDDGSELSEDELIDPDSELSVKDQKALIQLVKDFGNRPDSEMQAIHTEQEKHALALSRLLTVDLAIRCWHEIADRYPTSITEVSSDILSTILWDPFTDSEFVYRPTSNSFTLYSTGPDRTDCGGRFGPWPAVSNGGFDLCLDADDYWSDYCTIPQCPGMLRRLYWRLRSWWRPGAHDEHDATEP